MSDTLKIDVNLSIEKSGGEDMLPVVIEAVNVALMSRYPDAEINVRKGFFQTIDGVWSSDSSIEPTVHGVMIETRDRVLADQ